MDLLIKNVELPKNGRIVLAICADGAVYRYFGGKDKRPELKDRIDSAQEYLPNSPAIELPHHGDLIDRGELPISGCAYHAEFDFEDVMNAPVILEASNG